MESGGGLRIQRTHACARACVRMCARVCVRARAHMSLCKGKGVSNTKQRGCVAARAGLAWPSSSPPSPTTAPPPSLPGSFHPPQCCVANLIFRKYVKGYLAYRQRVVVLAKGPDAFPPLGAVQLADPFAAGG